MKDRIGDRDNVRVKQCGDKGSIQRIESNAAMGGGKPRTVYGLSLKSIVVSSIWIFILSWIVQYAEWTQWRQSIDGNVMPSASAGSILFILLVINFLFKKLAKKNAVFSNSELTTVFVMVTLAGLLLSDGLIGFFPGSLMGIGAGALGSRGQDPAIWKPILDDMSAWLIPKSEDAVIGYWYGLSMTNSGSVPWGEWILPIIVWTAFFGTIFWMFICISTLFRRQWTDYEHLVFPLTTPVLSVIGVQKGSKDPAFKGGKLMWGGILLTVIAYVVLAANRKYYWFTGLGTELDLRRYFRDQGVLHALSYKVFVMRISPLIIGISYLIPLDTLFSVWFGHLLIYKGADVVKYAIDGEPFMSGLNRLIGLGAYVAITASSIWYAKAHLKAVLVKAISGNSDLDDGNEPLLYRTAVVGGLVGLAGLILFSVFVLKMSVLVSLIFFVFLIAVVTAFARIRAASGVPISTAMPGSVSESMMGIASRQHLSKVDGMWLGIFQVASFLNFGGTMPIALESYKLGDEVGLKRKSVTFALLLAFVLGTIAAFAFALPIIYEYGQFSLAQWRWQMATQYGPWMFENTIAFDFPAIRDAIYIVIGGLVTTLFSMLKSRFIWWPIDPLGFAVGQTPWIARQWFSFFLAWMIKGLVYRYGGQKIYKDLIPFFTGLIIGFVLISILSTVASLPMVWDHAL
jgi:hypothetical protein